MSSSRGVGVRNPEDHIPTSAALFAYMLIPSAILFLAALCTTILLSNFQDRYVCHERVHAYLWGTVLLFYVWVLYHFTVLFGPPSWLRAFKLKLVLTGIIAVAIACWIAMGHVTLERYMDGECSGSVFHYTVVADLACMYSFFACMFGTLIVSALGLCRSVPECDEDIYDRATQPMLSSGGGGSGGGGGVYVPGAGIQSGALRSRRVGTGVASNSQLQSRGGREDDDDDDAVHPASPSHAASQSSAPQPPLSPHPQIEMMGDTPKAGGGRAGGNDVRMELRAMEREMMQGSNGGGGGLNQASSSPTQPQQQNRSDTEYDHLVVRASERMPLTPKMH